MPTNNQKPSIIVTGGAGYIGSHICKAISPSFIPVTIDNLSYGKKKFVKWGPLYEVDIQNEKALIEIFAKHRPIAVMHFAGLSSVVDSMENPAEYYRNNLLGSYHLLEACRRYAVKKMIFSSSCTVFGIPSKIPIQEEDPKQPISPYGKTKKMVEEMLEDYASIYGIHSVILRYFNAAGADLEGELGEDRKRETHLIPLAFKAFSQQMPLQIFGTDFNTPDGSAIRDFVHITDLAKAHILALEWLVKNEESEIFHIGSGKGTSVLEIIRSIEKTTESSLPLQIQPKRAGEPERLIADIQKAKKLLGWTPDFSDVDSIIESAFKWYMQLACYEKK